MVRALLICLLLAGCGGLSWNTTVADHKAVRRAMLASVHPGKTTEKRFALQWGHPTQKLREGAQVSYIYRNMSNPPGFYAPQFGTSNSYVVVLFQYGLAVGAYSSDTEGCRATFAPRPPGPAYDTPSIVHAVQCGVRYDGRNEHRPIAEAVEWLANQARGGGGGDGGDGSGGAMDAGPGAGSMQGTGTGSGAGPGGSASNGPTPPLVPEDAYPGGSLK